MNIIYNINIIYFESKHGVVDYDVLLYNGLVHFRTLAGFPVD